MERYAVSSVGNGIGGGLVYNAVHHRRALVDATMVHHTNSAISVLFEPAEDGLRFIVMMEELLFRTVSECGVPTIVCFFLLFRGTKAMDGLTEAINALVRHNEHIERDIDHILQLLNQRRNE